MFRIRTLNYLKTRRYKGKLVLLISFFVLGLFIFKSQNTRAANVTWDGGGSDSNWSTCANWVGDVCPGINDIAIFDATSTKSATIDATFAGSIGGIQINTGYTGTITQSRDLTVGASGFSQATGTFIDTSSTLTISVGNFVISGGTFNPSSGSVVFLGGGNPTSNITFAAPQAFNNVTFNVSSWSATITSGSTMVVNGTLTLGGTSGAVYGPGTISANGDIIRSSNGSVYQITVNFTNDSVAQTYTVNGTGQGPKLNFDSAADGNDTIVLNTNASFYGLALGASFSGTLAPTYNGHNMTIGEQGFSQAAGTFTAPPGTLTFSVGNFNVSGGTFDASTGTVVFLGGGNPTSNITIASSQAFNNLTFNVSSWSATITSGSVLTVNGTLTLGGSNGGVYGPGTISAKGDINLTNTGTSYQVTLDFANDSTAQTYTVNATGQGPKLNFDSAADANDTIVFNTNGTFYGFNIAPTFSGTISPTYNGHNMTIGAANFAQAAGTFAAPDATFNLSGSNFTVSGGTFDPGAGTVAVINSKDPSDVFNVATTQTFNNLTFNLSGWGASISSGDTLIVNGTLTFMGGGSVSGPGIISAKGNVTVNSSIPASNVPVQFTGDGNTQIFTPAGNPNKLTSGITINKISGEVRLAAALVMSAAQNLTVTSGTFNLNGKNLTGSGSISVGAAGTFKLQGAETMTLSGGAPTLAAGSTVVYTGDGDGLADSYELQNWAYKNLDVAFTDSSDSLSTNNITSDSNSGLQSHWAMDETVGGSPVADSAGTNTGTPQGTSGVNNKPQPSTDVPPVSFSDPRSLSFDGTDDYVSTANSYNNPQLFSISLWFKTASASGHKMFSLEDTQTGTGTNWTDRGLYIGTDGKLYFGWYPGSIVVIASTGTVTDNNWHNAIVTFSGTSASLYFDGQFQSSNNAGAAANFVGYWRIGGYKWNNWTNGSDGYFSGKLDDVKLYNRVLTASDIADLSSGAVPSGPTLNIVGNFILESGSFTPGVNIKISGNLTNTGGTFNASAGTVTMNGTSQAISGSNTFFGFTKAVSSADTLTFGASSTNTVTNALTLTGTSGQVLSLRSSADGTRWSIDPQGTRTIQYLDVKDSNNINATAMNITGQNINDSGNNLNWGFDSTAPVRSAGSPSGSVASGTTSTSISLTTDENATCKYSTTAGVAYASMTNTFDTTGTTSHSTTVSGLIDGGSYTYYVRCIDGSSNANTDDYAISFSVSDGESPTVSITSPADGNTVSGTITLTANASDNVSVEGVQFKLDGADLGAEDTSAPYSISWDSTTATNAAHVLTAVARDGAGNSTISSSINVTVSNDSSAPVISNATSTAPLPSGTKVTTISITTDESATCKYSTTAGVAYASMSNTFDTTGGTSHSTTVMNLQDATTYKYYVRCIDAYSNADPSDNIITIVVNGGGAVIDPASLMPPTAPDGGFKVIINNGAPVTNNRTVTLTLVYGFDTVSMAISTLPDLSDTGIKPASPAAFFDLCKTSECKPGHYTVYAKFYTRYGRSTPVIEGIITLTNSNANIPSVPQAPSLPTTIPDGKNSSYHFNRDLKVGSVGVDVRELQKYLNTQGFTVASRGAGSPGRETTTFGSATKKALIKFQEYFRDQILVPAGLSKGTGIFSKFTRMFVNGE